MNETMSLDGGILTYKYNNEEERCNNQNSPYGRKVVYSGENGTDQDQFIASKLFTKGQVLTVKEIYVGGWHSEVEFIEHEGKRFNTVMFNDLENYSEKNSNVR